MWIGRVRITEELQEERYTVSTLFRVRIIVAVMLYCLMAQSAMSEDDGATAVVGRLVKTYGAIQCLQMV